ncbi:hypothetical protein GF356_00905 [candidate division GN15 bacterium]|nr:hypothetical protein [candidate division GN15 bacterium]
MSHHWLTSALVLLLLLPLCGRAQDMGLDPGLNPGQPELIDKRIRRGGVGALAGFMNSSTFHIGGDDQEMNFGLSGGVFFDVPLIQPVALTITCDIHDIQIYSSRQMMLNPQIGFKPTVKYFKHKKYALRPSATVGFGYLYDVGRLEASSYLTFKGAFEALFFQNKNIGYVLELSVFGAPSGGNSAVDVSFGPVWSLRVGVMY